MNLPPLPLIDNCLFVDNSHWLEPLSTCTRLLEYQSLHQRISAAEKSALNFGTAQHLIREYRYKVYKNRELDQQYFENCATILSDFFVEHPCPEDDWRNLNWAIEVSKQYDKKYAVEGFTLLEYKEPMECNYCKGLGNIFPQKKLEDGKVEIGQCYPCLFCSGTGKNSMMVEMSFTLPLYEHFVTPQEYAAYYTAHKVELPGIIVVMYSGRIDLPCKLDNGIWVRDTKTASQFGEMFWAKMKMAAQQKGYCWSFQQLTGQKVQGYIVDGIRTKEPPKYVIEGKPTRGGKTQTPEQWWDESLQRERFYVTEDSLNEWKENAIELMEKFFWHYSRGYFPMETPNACTMFGRCQYYDVCSLAREDRGVMLASGLFINNLWTPLKEVKVNQENK